MKICPNCQVEYDDKFSFCNQCGSKLQDKVELFFCPFCGNRMETEGAFCPYCGKSLKDKKQSIEVSKTVNSEETELSSETKINFEKVPHNLFDKCEEIENQAVCKKSEVKFYPETDLKKIPHNCFDKCVEIEEGEIPKAEDIIDRDADATYAAWYSKKGLFSLRGRRSRSAFFAIDILLLLLFLVFNHLTRYDFFIGLIGSLLFIYINITNTSKRLHDLDKPATWAIIVYLLGFVGRMILDSNFRDPKYQYYWMMVEKYMNTEYFDVHVQAFYEQFGHVGIIFFAMIVIPRAVLYILMFFKGTDGPNRYGQDPLKIHSDAHKDNTKHFDKNEMFSRHQDF